MLTCLYMINKNFLTVKELADTLGISRIAVFNRIKKGQIKAEKIGRNYIIQREDAPGVGEIINEATKNKIDKGVRKTVEEYGEVLKLLGRE